MNSFPNFKAQIHDIYDTDFDIHFIGLFSTKPDAIPVLLLHGWPGKCEVQTPLVRRLAKTRF